MYGATCPVRCSVFVPRKRSQQQIKKKREIGHEPSSFTRPCLSQNISTPIGFVQAHHQVNRLHDVVLCEALLSSDVTLDQWIDLLHRYSYLDNVIQVHLYAISCNIMQPYPDIVGVVVESRRQRMDRALFMPFPHQSSRSIEFPRPKKFQLPTRLKKKNCRYSN